MENPNQGNDYNMPKNDWQNADNDSLNDDAAMMPGTAGNISSPTDPYTGFEFEASDKQDDPGNAKENDTDSDDADDDTEDEDTDSDAPHMNDWGDVDPQHGGSGSDAPSFPGSAF